MVAGAQPSREEETKPPGQQQDVWVRSERDSVLDAYVGAYAVARTHEAVVLVMNAQLFQEDKHAPRLHSVQCATFA